MTTTVDPSDSFLLRTQPNPVRLTEGGLRLSVEAAPGERFRLYDSGGRLRALGEASDGSLRLTPQDRAAGPLGPGVYLLEATGSGQTGRVVVLD